MKDSLNSLKKKYDSLFNERDKLVAENNHLKGQIVESRSSYQTLVDGLSAFSSSSNGLKPLPTTKPDPAPLNWKDYPNVKYWDDGSYTNAKKHARGMMDGLETKTKPRGQPSRTSTVNSYPYLQNADGSSVPKAVTDALRQDLPDEIAKTFIINKILNNPKYFFLRLCIGWWKAMTFIGPVFSDWIRYFESDSKDDYDDDGSAPPAKRRWTSAKEDILDEPSLLRMSEELDVKMDIDNSSPGSEMKGPTTTSPVINPLSDADLIASLDDYTTMTSSTPAHSSTMVTTTPESSTTKSSPAPSSSKSSTRPVHSSTVTTTPGHSSTSLSAMSTPSSSKLSTTLAHSSVVTTLGPSTNSSAPSSTKSLTTPAPSHSSKVTTTLGPSSTNSSATSTPSSTELTTTLGPSTKLLTTSGP
ncbi:hypothetical protein VKT23_010215 [Stygiomarasmius scandens]|uniref:Uncharacterized protein n=1 Tax=Marasmiellus scandens TaxID=2682957 RepID=A0ABR1JF09_9AGAR